MAHAWHPGRATTPTFAAVALCASELGAERLAFLVTSSCACCTKRLLWDGCCCCCGCCWAAHGAAAAQPAGKHTLHPINHTCAARLLLPAAATTTNSCSCCCIPGCNLAARLDRVRHHAQQRLAAAASCLHLHPAHQTAPVELAALYAVHRCWGPPPTHEWSGPQQSRGPQG
jgi:hypothetical protein